jgi:hypothetical protein
VNSPVPAFGLDSTQVVVIVVNSEWLWETEEKRRSTGFLRQQPLERPVLCLVFR